MPYLKGKVCLVTGASRGIGKGIALQLALNGATCYITGRSLEKLNLVKEEAEERDACGRCIPIQCDHSDDAQVKQLFEQIANENDGQLDLLVNNAYSAVNWLIEHAKENFWDQPDDGWDVHNIVGLRNNYICAVQASRLMVKRRKGLIVNISSMGSVMYVQTPPYSIGKAGVRNCYYNTFEHKNIQTQIPQKDKMTRDCGIDLEPFNVAFVSLWPGVVRTETVLSAKERIGLEPDSPLAWLLENGESTEFTGKCIASLLADQNIMKRTGQAFFSSDIAAEFDIKDIDGQIPANMRSIKSMAAVSGAAWLSKYIPSFIKVPFGVLTTLVSYNKHNEKKEPTKYA